MSFLWQLGSSIFYCLGHQIFFTKDVIKFVSVGHQICFYRSSFVIFQPRGEKVIMLSTQSSIIGSVMICLGTYPSRGFLSTDLFKVCLTLHLRHSYVGQSIKYCHPLLTLIWLYNLANELPGRSWYSLPYMQKSSESAARQCNTHEKP